MSEIKSIFYNIFWQNKACQNLFLLSKEELLDTKSFPLDDENVSRVSFPRIIISNVDKEDDKYQIIKYRTEGGLIKSQTSFNGKIEKYTPLITNFLESRFGKSLEKISQEFSTNPGGIAKFLFRLVIASDEKKESLVISELQKYHFVGRHIKTFSQLEDYFKKEFAKNIKGLFSEENTWNFFEFLKSLKDIYTNETYKNLYETNQILVNSLFANENFIDRLKLFNLLYESEIISSSREDAIVECTNCSPGTYRGVFQLTVNPLKLNEFKCPICSKQLNYYVPYELHHEIYSIIKLKDGLLLDALCNLLKNENLSFKTNQSLLSDIEIDCIVEPGMNSIYIVECKMYKVNTSPQKLKSKMKEHYGKLMSDINRLKVQEFKGKNVIPILLVNINQSNIIDEVKEEFNLDDRTLQVNILNINEIATFVSKN